MTADRHTITVPRTRLAADASAVDLQEAIRALSDADVTIPADRAVRRAEYRSIARTAAWIATAAEALAADLADYSDID